MLTAFALVGYLVAVFWSYLYIARALEKGEQEEQPMNVA